MKAGQVIVFFLTLYVLFGVTNYLLLGTPNNTSDFIFHYYKITGDVTNPELAQFYLPIDLYKYPDFFHSIASPFVQNKLFLYVFAVILICLIMPALLYKLAGDYAVIIYFALSLPHMVIYNATFPSFLVFIYIAIYFLNRKNWVLLISLTFLAMLTHKEGLLIFSIIWVAEIISKIKFPKNTFHGFLLPSVGFTIQNTFNLFASHMNFYFIWIARKKFNQFYLILFVIGIISVVRDFRVIALSQIVLCIVAGNALKETKPTKTFWVIWGFLVLYNTLSFMWGSEMFLLH